MEEDGNELANMKKHQKENKSLKYLNENFIEYWTIGFVFRISIFHFDFQE